MENATKQPKQQIREKLNNKYIQTAEHKTEEQTAKFWVLPFFFTKSLYYLKAQLPNLGQPFNYY